MKYKVGFITLFVTVMGFAQFGTPNAVPRNTDGKGLSARPLFYVLDWKLGTQLREEPTELAIEVDSLGLQEVNALVDVGGTKVLYTSDISTPVCADGECRLMHIRLYWTLLGDYAGFDPYPHLPLTKHDHDEFRTSDYLKLHQLLMDDNSILKRRKIDELVEKPKEPAMEGVDAVAGATIKEVKESVVDGALYSCYTAWHLVHGPIKEAILKRTKASLEEATVLSMLSSNHPQYQMFALKRLDQDQYEENHDRIAEIFASGIPLVRSFIVKNLPESFWQSQEIQRPFWQNFSTIDINSRSLLLNHLDKAPEAVVENLSQQMASMTKNQLKLFLEHLEGSEKVNPRIKANLMAFSSADTETNAYLVAYFLEDYE